MPVRFKVTEWHQVASIKSYDIDDETAIEEFGSAQRLAEVASWQEKQMFDNDEIIGEQPTDEEHDKFWELVGDCDYDTEEDWWTARKGGYEVTVGDIEQTNE